MTMESTATDAVATTAMESAAPKQRQVLDNMAQPYNSTLAAMSKIDAFLRFLTKATGKTSVPFTMLANVLPDINASSTPESTSHSTEPEDEVKNDGHVRLREILLELNHRGVLHYDIKKEIVGFPLPPSPSRNDDESSITPESKAAASDSAVAIPRPPSKLIGKGLHGSTEPSAKRRMKFLEWSIQHVPYSSVPCSNIASKIETGAGKVREKKEMHTTDKKRKESILMGNEKNEDLEHPTEPLQDINAEDERLDECTERRAAYQALDSLLRGKTSSLHDNKDAIELRIDYSTTKKQWLPCQAAYAGTHSGRDARYKDLSKETASKIHPNIFQIFNLSCDGNSRMTDTETSPKKRRLFLHQARAIESAMSNVHTVVQTATGSGKSICFLLPVLARVIRSIESGERSTSLLLFPTKALAQDQYSKINALLKSLSSRSDTDDFPICAGVLDGDTAHSQRDVIASECQIILTNPDTLHAAILPNWNKRPAYQHLLASLSTVVVDEAHVYEGSFGAHVAMVLSRLVRVCRVASSPSNTDNITPARQILFIACSATMLHPEKHFRLLCPIGVNENVCVLTSEDDGSPCSAKHFFVWNPPILDVNGNSTDSIFLTKSKGSGNELKTDETLNNDINHNEKCVSIPIGSRKRKKNRYFHKDPSLESTGSHQTTNIFTRRRHAADETAFLLAKAITAGVRTIAFCRTRSLVEWVYEKTLSILQSDKSTYELTSKVESYRGGYTMEARRSIEDRLFHRKLFGVVGTCALELGVDVGGVDLTLHTGYPGSISSVLQQSGRAGRGKEIHCVSSCAIMVCFSSPSEQHIWKNPKTLLSRGLDTPPNLPINDSVMQGHLLCAGDEFPLTGDRPVSCILNEVSIQGHFQVDCDLLGPSNIYQDNVEYLAKKGLLSKKHVRIVSERSSIGKSEGTANIPVYSTHPIVKDPWKRVSLRSIEPVSYSIVDLSHNSQGGKTDKIHNQAAVLDTIPYSRVFFHAFPGAIIMHRGRKYKIESMESPPPFLGGTSSGPCGCANLLAFAKPTSLQYTTQVLSTNEITVVKQMKHAKLIESNDEEKGGQVIQATVAGYGVVTVKRTVHGYKKLSLINRTELSRTTISLPSMEFDTRACWIDVDAIYLKDIVRNFDAGVHALSHALVAVTPLFVSCATADIDCDHSRFDRTQILLYDQRVGGSGITVQLYNNIFDALKASVDLLEECTSCYSGKDYDGGCPACLHSIPCDNFHQDLSRLAGIQVGKHLIKKLEVSSLNGRHGGQQFEDGTKKCTSVRVGTDMQCSPLKPKNFLIGRTSWMENSSDHTRWAAVDED